MKSKQVGNKKMSMKKPKATKKPKVKGGSKMSTAMFNKTHPRRKDGRFKKVR